MLPFIFFPAIFLFLGTGAILSGYKAIDFDLSGNRFRPYLSIFFLKFGKWKQSDKYPYIYILTSYRSSAKFMGKQQMTLVDIILTDTDYREKIALSINNSEEGGRQEAARLAALLGKEFVPYSPRPNPRSRRKKDRRH